MDVLWRALLKYRGTDGYDLCRRLGLPIYRSPGLTRLNALLSLDRDAPSGHHLVLPEADPLDWSAREGLLIYHEVAHFLVRDVVPGRTPCLPETDLSKAEESWCDNFALAMLLAMFNLEATDEENAHAFFNAGAPTDLAGRDAHAAATLQRFCDEAPPTWQPPLTPLLLLIKELKAAPA